jgi:hypothetical protein
VSSISAAKGQLTDVTNAIEAVVAAYVHTNQLDALLDLKAHREKLAASIRDRTHFDFGVLLGQLEDDIVAIEAGIRRLHAGNGSRTEPDSADTPGRPHQS